MLKSFEFCNKEYIYEMVFSKNGETEVSGIRAYKKGSMSNPDETELCIIEDISADSLFVGKLIDYLCYMKVPPIHTKDIVEDILQLGETAFIEDFHC